MMRFLCVFTVVCATFVMQGCLTAPVVPPYGAIYSDIKAPLDHDMGDTAVGTRSGRAESVSYVGLVAMGDSSINEAARQGRLRVIHSADYEYVNIVGIIQRYTTVVYGE